MSKFLKFLEWEERMAEEIRNDQTDDRHTTQWSERYWHGYAAAMRHAQQRFKDEFTVVTKGRGDEDET